MGFARLYSSPRAHDRGRHAGLAGEDAGAQHLEHLVGHEQRRLAALDQRLERRPRHVLIGTRLAERRLRVGVLNLWVPARVEQRLADDRDRAL